MNNAMQALLNRRSIRQYKPELPPGELLEQIIGSGLVETLIAHFDEVDAARAKHSREAGKRYYDSLRATEG